MMVQGKYGECKTVHESVIDVLRKVTGDSVETVFEETVNISRANEAAVQTLSLAEDNEHHDAGVAAVLSNADYYGNNDDWPDFL